MANTIDMTGGGNLTRKIIMFALPLMASGIVQQSFNAMDVAVVGKFVGAHALAAVGANGPVIGLLVNLFIGISVGANVVIATCIGQRNRRDVGRAVSTSAIVALVGGFAMLLLGVTVTAPILEMLETPANIIDDAAGYLRIFSLGFPAMMVYNFGNAILRSTGDTKRPFYWLVIGGLVNVTLNLFLVLVCGMGVNGVAIATVVANCVSASGIVMILVREKSDIHLDIRALKVWRTQLRKILQIGVPAGLQGMVFALSNVFIQSAINRFGSEAVAGSAAAITFELYCYFVISSFVQAAVAFMSQNYGAGEYHRCKVIYRRCLLLAMGCCAAFNFLIICFHSECLSLFTSDPRALQFATERLLTVLAFQWVASTYEVSAGAMRSVGYSLTPTIIIIAGTCVVRIAWVHLRHFADFTQLLVIYPISWALTGVCVTIAWFVVARRTLHSRQPAPQGDKTA